MISVNDIRTKFLDYFEDNDHARLPAASLIPHNDPSLLFTSAGMVKFKNVFTGLERPGYNRAVTSQKCLRAGGKHNDLDNVGHTARHLTFFEMLGNFSFGDYFKEKAIYYSWNLLTKDFALPKEKLLVTVYHTDTEAANYWKKIAGLSDDRIIRIATDDNFWSMGDVGPCGPCSEIFYDHGADVWGGPPGSAEEDGDRFMEIWNLVFMQYEQLSLTERVPLPAPCIDTGMGLERVSTILQGVHNVYDLDLFQTIIKATEELTNRKAAGDLLPSFRVIADHLRSMCFLIADGILPSNEGRGYVLRRIMRRAMRHANLIGVNEPVLWKLAAVLEEVMGKAYPELGIYSALIRDTILLEESRFQRTLSRGLTMLNDASQNLQAGDVLDGDLAFKLYDTYGFPLDLTEDILRKRNISVNTEAFDNAMAKQKAEARASWVGSGETALGSFWFNVQAQTGGTEFLGYDKLNIAANIVAIIKDDHMVQKAVAGDKVQILVNQTVFYAESGGQVGDIGYIKADGLVIKVEDTQKRLDNLYVHFGEVVEGQADVGMSVELSVDSASRRQTMANHSATHLLHASLRSVLGEHVVQKGSLVTSERLRFDFAHSKPLSNEEIEAVSKLVNSYILQNSPVTTCLMSKEEAQAKGAMALFDDKYGDLVRVISMGHIDNQPDLYWSHELCGGTHVKATGDIGLFHIIAESGVAAGIRRIEALTGAAARAYLLDRDDSIKNLANYLKVSANQVVERVSALYTENNQLIKQISDLKKQLILSQIAEPSMQQGMSLGNFQFIGQVVDMLDSKALKALVDKTKQKIGSGIVALISLNESGVATLVVGVSDDLTKTYSAVDLVKIGSTILGGKGGGRADLAQGGGANGEASQMALKAIEASIKDKLITS